MAFGFVVGIAAYLIIKSQINIIKIIITVTHRPTTISITQAESTSSCGLTDTGAREEGPGT